MVKKRKQVSATSNLSHTSQRALEPLDQLLKNAEMGDNERKITYLFLALKYIDFQRSNGWANRETLKEYYEKENQIFNQLKKILTVDILLKEETLEESLLKQIFLSNTDLLAKAYDQRSEEGVNIFNIVSSILKSQFKIVVEGQTFYLQNNKENGEKIKLVSVSEPIISMVTRKERDIPIQKDASHGDIVSPSKRRNGVSLMEQIRLANGKGGLKSTGVTSPRAAFLQKQKEVASRPGFALSAADVQRRKGTLKKAVTSSSQRVQPTDKMDPELAGKLEKQRKNPLLPQRRKTMLGGTDEHELISSLSLAGQVSEGEGRIDSKEVVSQGPTVPASTENMMIDGAKAPATLGTESKEEVREVRVISSEEYLAIIGSQMRIQRLLAEGDNDRDPNETPKPKRRKDEMPLETPAKGDQRTKTPSAPIKRGIRKEESDSLRKRRVARILQNSRGEIPTASVITDRFDLLRELLGDSSNDASRPDSQSGSPVAPPSISHDPRMST